MYYIYVEFINGLSDKIYLSTDREEAEQTWNTLKEFLVNGESGLFEVRYQIIRTDEIQNLKLIYDSKISGEMELQE